MCFTSSQKLLCIKLSCVHRYRGNSCTLLMFVVDRAPTEPCCSCSAPAAHLQRTRSRLTPEAAHTQQHLALTSMIASDGTFGAHPMPTTMCEVSRRPRRCTHSRALVSQCCRRLHSAAHLWSLTLLHAVQLLWHADHDSRTR